VPRDQILVIGDGAHTDIAGATNLGIDSVFVASGLHARGAAGDDALRSEQLEALFAPQKKRPIGAMRALVW
jgi:ribonucleotide monophosphatase NagD (HAD superfamily)